MNHDAQYIARQFGKSAQWFVRQARAGKIPHSRAGRTYYWSDEDLVALREHFRVRPEQRVVADPMRPIPARTRRAS